MSKCFIFFTIIVGLSFTSQAQTKSTNTPSELGKQAAELLQKSDFELMHRSNKLCYDKNTDIFKALRTKDISYG